MSLKKQFLKSKKAYSVTFSLPNEVVNGAKEVLLLGDFNQWGKDAPIPMKNAKDGFMASMELKPGQEYEFRYLVDNKTWVNDREADKYVSTPFGVENSVVVVPAEMEN
ncbi:MAG: isoamylase early set domain-containing protein [Saprospiraceae bacterium]|nr:isoamylase early set domain-containing protein [Saprospiraceae bacterium]